MYIFHPVDKLLDDLPLTLYLGSMIMKFWTVIFSLWFALGCTSGGEANTSKPGAEKSEDLIQLNRQLDSIVALCEDFNLDRYLSYFANDAIIFPPGRGPLIGVDSIRQFLSGFNDVFIPSFTCEYSDRNFEIHDSLAVRSYRSYGEIPYRQSDDILISDNKYVDILIRKPDGSWKIIRQMWNSNKN